MIVIKKVLNSSVILGEEAGKEKILLGKGIGYGKKQGETILESDVDQVFIPVESAQAQQIVELLVSIPEEFLEITQKTIKHAEEVLDIEVNSSIYFTLMDHLNFAVERFKKGITITNRVYWEISSYYPKELEVSHYCLDLIEDYFGCRLPFEEAGNIAFHLINAQSGEENTGNALKSAKMIGSIVNLVRYSLGMNIDTESIHYSRFITHVKFFVERFFSDELMTQEDNMLYNQIATLYPQAMNGALKVRDYIEKVYGKSMANEEVAYLAVHINRLISYSEIEEKKKN